MTPDLQLCKLSDEQVVELAKSGSREAYDHIITRYRNYVYAKAKSYYIKGADQDDLIQEGMIGLYKAVKDYNPELSTFAGFAKVCVVRQMITAVKNSTRNKHMPLNTYVSIEGSFEGEAEGVLDIPDNKNSPDPESIMIDRESLSGIEFQINQSLSKFESEVLAYYLDGFSYQDIATKVKKDVKAVDNAIQRIRKKLENVLDK